MRYVAEYTVLALSLGGNARRADWRIYVFLFLRIRHEGDYVAPVVRVVVEHRSAAKKKRKKKRRRDEINSN